jgi:hypothetical protein
MYFSLCYASELSVTVGIFDLLCLVNTIHVYCKCYWAMSLFHPGFTHPRGTLASRGRVAQTANGVIKVRAPALTSSAAPVRTGVRSCGLITLRTYITFC